MASAGAYLSGALFLFGSALCGMVFSCRRKRVHAPAH
jgi:hypothetical protein